MKKVLVLAVPMLLLAGCGAGHQHHTFCLPGYQQSLYAYHKESTEENARKHIEVLERIIQHAQESGLKVPPGIYLEKGWFHQLLGNEQQAEADCLEEISRYPEAEAFISKILLNAKKQKDDAF